MAPYTSNEINIRIVPKRIRWPEPRASVAWAKAHDCVDALQNLIRQVDRACLEAERDRELSAGGIPRRRTEICDQAFRELANLAAFEIAEKALIANIGALERLSDRDPDQIQMLQRSKQGLADLREGIPATQRMLMERCKLRERALV